MDQRRIRRNRQSRRPRSQNSMYCTIAGFVGIAVYVLSVLFAIFSAGTTARIFACLDTLMMFVSIGCFFYGWHLLKDSNYDPLFRWLGLIIPGISMLLYLIVFSCGLMLG